MTSTSADCAPAIALKHTRFRYAGNAHDSLDIPELTIAQGERVFVQGKSGSGKTTLLNLLSGINTPTSGEVHVLGEPLHTMRSAQRDQFRAAKLGVVFQQFNLIPYLSVLENVTLPTVFQTNHATRNKQTLETGKQVLAALEISPSLFQNKAQTLSVGQQQRVAVARALASKPQLVIADEPTSALDADNRNRFIELLFNEVKQHGSTLIFVSHDRELAPHFGRMMDLAEINHANT